MCLTFNHSVFIVCINVSQRRQIPHEDGSAIRRKGRTLRMRKQHLDSDSSQREERDALGEGNGNVQNAVRIRQSRSYVRYPEDSDIGDNVKQRAKERYREDDDYVAYKNVDPLMQNENGIVKRNKIRSAQEATKRLKKNFDASSDDE